MCQIWCMLHFRKAHIHTSPEVGSVDLCKLNLAALAVRALTVYRPADFP